MKNNLLRWTRFMIICSLYCTVSAQSQYKIVGYYPAWNRSIIPASQLRLDILTHVNHSFAWPTVTGTIQGDANVPDAALINAVHAGGKKVLIALGGWGHEAGFIPVATDTSIRRVFVSNLFRFVTENSYDGIDLDWEFPVNTAQRDSLTSLVKEIRRAFDSIDSSLLITMAVPISNWSGQWIDFQKLLPFIDWFNAMVYDIHGSWTNHAGHNAPLFAPSSDYDGSAHQGIQYLHLTRGIPKNKLTLGVPFYGKQFTASAMYTPQSGVFDVTYSTVLSRIQSGWEYHWDDVSQVPYLISPAKTAVLTFDDSTSIARKCRYVKDEQLSGMMMWALGQDVVSGTQPLIESIGDALVSPNSIVDADEQGLQNTIVYDIHPNPFNHSTTVSITLPEPSVTTVTVFDPLGGVMETIVDQFLPKGSHVFRWNAERFASGIYFCRLSVGQNMHTRKLVLIK